MLVRSIVAQGELNGETLAVRLAEALQGKDIDRLDVAVAYATASGLQFLHTAVGAWPAATRWVVGLDDAITEPAAIDALLALAGSSVRLAKLGPARRFHPKLYCFWSSADASTCVAVFGSANMTHHGLALNGESAVVLEAETQEDATQLRQSWQDLSALGFAATAAKLNKYRVEYARAKAARRRMARVGSLPFPPEETTDPNATPTFDGTPRTAVVAWTEGATPSAGGRDLEFPKDMMPFFRLGASPTTKRFRMANGQVFNLTFTLRTDNLMWRLLFSSEAILAGIGRETLRPVAGNITRSDLTIVFHRITGAADYDVELLVINNPEDAALKARTTAVGVIDRTRDPGGRFFGYY